MQAATRQKEGSKTSTPRRTQARNRRQFRFADLVSQRGGWLGDALWCRTTGRNNAGAIAKSLRGANAGRQINDVETAIATRGGIDIESSSAGRGEDISFGLLPESKVTELMKIGICQILSIC